MADALNNYRCVISWDIPHDPVVHTDGSGPHLFSFHALWAQILENGPHCPVCRVKISLDFTVDERMQAEIDEVVRHAIDSGSSREELVEYQAARAENLPCDRPSKVVSGVDIKDFTDWDAFQRRISLHRTLIGRAGEVQRVGFLPESQILTALALKASGSLDIATYALGAMLVFSAVRPLFEILNYPKQLDEERIMLKNLSDLTHTLKESDRIEQLCLKSPKALRAFLLDSDRVSTWLRAHTARVGNTQREIALFN